MKQTKIVRAAIAVALTALIAGCNLPPERASTDCDAQRVEPIAYQRQATGFLRLGKLPRGARVVVRDYRLSVERSTVVPCSQLRLRKEVALVRSAHRGLVLKEVREFYAEDGTLIVRSVEDVSRQLAATGAYGGSLYLPIPPQAPAGIYRVVNKLLWEGGKGRPVQLSESEAEFRVVRDDD